MYIGQGYANRGQAKLALGMYGEAIADYDSAIARNQDYEEAFLGRGLAKSGLDQAGSYDEAIADFDRAIRLNPNNAYAFFGRGIANV